MLQCSAFIALNNERKKSKDGAGGGMPKIDLPVNQSKPYNNLANNKFSKNNTMRGVSKRPVSTAASRINVIAKVSFKQTRYISRKTLSTMINYNLDRERGRDEPERSLFTSKLSDLDRHLAQEEIERNFGEHVAYHKIILSSGDNHVNQRDFTRTVMTEWQRSIDKEFEYYAVEHRNTDYHHVHIIISGKSSSHSNDLILDREDVIALREIGGDYLARDRFMDRELDREIALEFGRDKLDREVEQLFNMSKRDYERDQTAIGLETYKEMRDAQKELGLLFQYDPDRLNKDLDRIEPDHNPANEISSIDYDNDLADEHNNAWDKDLGDKLYEQNGDEERDIQSREIDHEELTNTRRRNDDDSE